MAESAALTREVAAAVGLAEGESGVRAVLAAVARLEPVSVRRLSRAVELPVPIVAAVCGELRKRLVVAEERPVQLTPFGRDVFAPGALALGQSRSCTACHGRGAVLPQGLGRLRSEIRRATEPGPPARLELDQCHCTFETKLRRVLALHEADALVGRRVLLLGDDDLTSVAIGATVRELGAAATIAGLTVLDVDPAVLAYAGGELADAPFPATFVEHDLRVPLGPPLRGAFDTVFTDPPYTEPAARLFLSRAAEALVGAGGDVFLCFGSRRPGAAHLAQRAMGEAGFTIRQLVRDFNRYVGAGVLGGTSHLYHLVATKDVRPLVEGVYDGPLYTAES
ncbi:MAG: bis-aminopropyl spermidine synthase family protein [Gaiellaceae bacterium]